MAELLPDPDLVEELRAKIVTGPKWLCKYSAQTFSLGYMHGWAVAASQAHSAECDLTQCNTCTNFVHALSLFAAYSIEFPPSGETMLKLFGT